MRLSKLEREMLRRSAQFALAGEWPWENDDSPKAYRTWQRERNALESAINKLEQANDRK